MKLRSFWPALLVLAACDLTRELQGPSDSGTTDGAPSGDSGNVPPDGGDTGNLPDGSAPGPVSTCVPKSVIGKIAIDVKGNESPYFNSVTDIAFGAGMEFVLGVPWTMIGVPSGGVPGPASPSDALTRCPVWGLKPLRAASLPAPSRAPPGGQPWACAAHVKQVEGAGASLRNTWPRPFEPARLHRVLRVHFARAADFVAAMWMRLT